MVKITYTNKKADYIVTNNVNQLMSYLIYEGFIDCSIADISICDERDVPFDYDFKLSESFRHMLKHLEGVEDLIDDAKPYIEENGIREAEDRAMDHGVGNGDEDENVSSTRDYINDDDLPF